ncbi:MAG: undecaprenyl-diphosphate phosphatase [Candidatus Bathyarchaeota archaeon]|nr:undecaprenyl-diphosphate phosphatase [Candidatus Bathyarchaeum sp.]
MTITQAILLAIIQGLTEWLPISSSGHLAIAQQLLGLNPPLIFDVTLHLGTLTVVLIAFRKDITNILKALTKRDFQTPQGKTAIYIATGSIPIAVIALTFYDTIKSLFSNLTAIAIALIITGCILFVSEKRVGTKKMNTTDSILIGLAQAIAIIPGISRSGTTVSTALLRKIDKTTAFKYSFLLSIPAVIGATILEAKDLVTGNIDLAPLLVGAIVSMLVGYASLKLLQKIVINQKLHLFAYYCWTAGTAILVFILFH